MKKIIKYCLIINLTLFSLLISCKNQKKGLDTSTINIDIPSNLFHNYLIETAEYSQENWQKEIDKNESFIDQYSRNVLGESPEESIPILNEFRNYFDSIGIYQLVDSEFHQLPEEETFVEMQKRLKVLFPSYEPIALTTMVSGFNYKNMLLDDQIGIGLELYLGDSFDYQKLGTVIHDYQLHQFQRSYIVPDAATSIINDFYEDRGEYNTFLKKIIYEGKKLYLKSLILPNTDPSILLGLTEEDYDWCVKNEQLIWQYFVSEELLYSHEIKRWKTYVFEGPFSAGMPENAPALTGNYIGLKIIESYMENHPDLSVRELLENEDANGIFQKAKYTP